jgi:hypothetical protein
LVGLVGDLEGLVVELGSALGEAEGVVAAAPDSEGLDLVESGYLDGRGLDALGRLLPQLPLRVEPPREELRALRQSHAVLQPYCYFLNS